MTDKYGEITRNSYPKLNSPSDKTSGVILTPDMITRFFEVIRISGDRMHEERFTNEALVQGMIENEAARQLGVDKLTEKQKQDLWDGIAEWYLRRYTDLLD